MDLIKQIRSYRGKKCSEYAEMKSSDLNNYSFHAYEECISKTNEYYVDLSRNIDFVEKFIKHQKQ